MTEVDLFLDEVEAELERLTIENEELRAKLAAVSAGEPTGLMSSIDSTTDPNAAPSGSNVLGAEKPVAASATISEQLAAAQPSGESVPASMNLAEPARVDAESTAAARQSMGEASSAAARLLEIASNNADQLMESAKEEADRVVGEARTKAERIGSEARGKADRLETDARIRAQKLDDETNERRQQAVAAIERERYELQREVEHLRGYEREYRARLKNYFESQLEQLAASENTVEPSVQQGPEAGQRRARSLLGETDSI